MWDYYASIEQNSQGINSFNSGFKDLVKSFWEAKERISLIKNSAGRPKKGQVKLNWHNYCLSCGVSKTVVNRWLKRYDPSTDVFLTEDQYAQKKKDVANKRKQLVIYFFTTGIKT